MTPCCSLGPCYLFIPFLIFLYNNYLHVYIDPLIKPVWDVIDPYIGHYIRNEDPATGILMNYIDLKKWKIILKKN